MVWESAKGCVVEIFLQTATEYSINFLPQGWDPQIERDASPAAARSYRYKYRISLRKIESAITSYNVIRKVSWHEMSKTKTRKLAFNDILTRKKHVASLVADTRPHVGQRHGCH